MCRRSTSSAKPPAGSGAPEAPEQVVVASAAADGDAERRVVDLEHRARVVAEVAHQAEVEDHALGDRGLAAARARRACRRALGPGPSLGSSTSVPPRSCGHAQEQRGLLGAEAGRGDLALQPHEVARDELVRGSRARVLGARRARPAARGTARRRRAPRGSRCSPAASSARQRTAERLGRALGRGRRRSARCPPGGTRAPGRAAGARRGRRARSSRSAAAAPTSRVAGGHDARDRDRHVRAQHQHVAVLVEQAVGGPAAASVARARAPTRTRARACRPRRSRRASNTRAHRAR